MSLWVAKVVVLIDLFTLSDRKSMFPDASIRMEKCDRDRRSGVQLFREEEIAFRYFRAILAGENFSWELAPAKIDEFLFAEILGGEFLLLRKEPFT